MRAFYHDSLFPVTKVCRDCQIEYPPESFYRDCPRCIPCEKRRRKQCSQERLKQCETLPPDTMKVCTVCQIEKSLDDFYKRGAGTLGRSAMCKICTLEAAGYTNHMQKIPTAQHGGKVCHKCLQEKPLDAFYKDSRKRDGLNLTCKECASAYESNYAYKTGKRKRSAPLPKPVNGGKVCTKCLTEKPLTEFAKKSSSSRDGYNQLCKECANANRRKRYAASDKTQKNEQSRQWYEANKQRHRELVAEWRKSNRYKNNEYHRLRRAHKLALTLEEVDYERILERDGLHCYICDKDILPHHKIDFDHVIPLSRDGVHAEWNIKPTHHVCNRRKYNKLLDEMSSHQRRGPD